MSEFDGNGYETAETVETIETVETVDAGGSYDAGGYTAPNYDSTYAEPKNDSKVFAIISLVCGILSLLCSCCGWLGILIAVAGVVLGIISIKKEEDAKGMAIAGIICGGIGLLIAIIVIVSLGALSSADPESIKQYFENLEKSI